MTKLNNTRIKWLIRQIIKHGKKPSEVASVYGITARRVRQLIQSFHITGKMPILNTKRRPKIELTDKQKEFILKAAKESRLSGAVTLRLYIKKHYDTLIPRNKLHQFLLQNGVSKPDKKKQKQRKYCRYERKHSFSLVHIDWHESKIIPGKHVCSIEDDASRIILCGGEFDDSKAEKNIQLMRKAIQIVYTKYSATIREVNSDKGSQFYANKYNEKGEKGQSEFEKYLMKNNMNHIPSRRNHPQTNGKKERWFRTYEEKRGEFETFKEFVDWYNDRIHLGLSRIKGITPNEAVLNKLKEECLIGLFWRYQ